MVNTWDERLRANETPRDPRLARIHTVYHEFKAGDIEQGWVFFRDAWKKHLERDMGTTEEMMLMNVYWGVVALAGRTRISIATATSIATWNLSTRHADERPLL